MEPAAPPLALQCRTGAIAASTLHYILDETFCKIPPYGGDADSFEEYEERCWDLFYGREGQDSL